jgi:hypothetical protein
VLTTQKCLEVLSRKAADLHLQGKGRSSRNLSPRHLCVSLDLCLSFTPSLTLCLSLSVSVCVRARVCVCVCVSILGPFVCVFVLLGISLLVKLCTCGRKCSLLFYSKRLRGNASSESYCCNALDNTAQMKGKHVMCTWSIRRECRCLFAGADAHKESHHTEAAIYSGNSATR